MDGLVSAFSRCPTEKNPNLIIKWLQNIIDTLHDRLSTQKLDISYPKAVTTCGVLPGPLIGQRHLDMLLDLKLQPINLPEDLTPEESYHKLESYLKNSSLSATLMITVKREVCSF